QSAAAKELAGLGCRIIGVNEVGGRPWLPDVAEALVAEGITRLLVEGGPTVWRSFSEAGLADEVVIFRAGGGKAAGNYRCPDISTVAQLASFLSELALHLYDVRPVSVDVMLIY